MLSNSLDELANGRYDYRIADERKDEFGELYAEFDKTAAALEERHEPPQPRRCAVDRAAVALATPAGRRSPRSIVARMRRSSRPVQRSPRAVLRLRARRRRPRAGARRARAEPGPSRARRRLRRRRRRPGDDLATLAQRYLGDAEQGWWIAEFNGIDEVRAGQDRRHSAARPQPDRRLRRTASRRSRSSAITASAAQRSKLTVTPAAFEAQMEYLARNGYHVITMARLAELPRGQGAAAEEDRS